MCSEVVRMLIFVFHVKTGGLVSLCASLCCLGARANYHSKKIVTFLELFLRDFVFLLKVNYYLEIVCTGYCYRFFFY
jgi:hypothetical protein